MASGQIEIERELGVALKRVHGGMGDVAAFGGAEKLRWIACTCRKWVKD
jgi:hypothetical protein